MISSIASLQEVQAVVHLISDGSLSQVHGTEPIALMGYLREELPAAGKSLLLMPMVYRRSPELIAVGAPSTAVSTTVRTGETCIDSDTIGRGMITLFEIGTVCMIPCDRQPLFSFLVSQALLCPC